jgi:glucose/arabinose dehydrogenase
MVLLNGYKFKNLACRPMDDDWENCDAEAVVAALSARYRFSRANAVQLLRDEGILRQRAEAEHDDDDDVEEAEGWANCDAKAVVAALSARYRFSRANAVQLLRDEGSLRPRAEAEHDDDDDVEEAEEWGREEEGGEEERQRQQVAELRLELAADAQRVLEREFSPWPMPGQEFVSVGAVVVGTGDDGFQDGAAAAAMFGCISAMLHLPDGRVLVVEWENHSIRMLSADLQQVSTVAGVGRAVGTMAGVVVERLVAAEAREAAAEAAVETAAAAGHGGGRVAGGGGVCTACGAVRQSALTACCDADVERVERVRLLRRNRESLWRRHAVAAVGGHRDGAAAQAQFYHPGNIALLPDGRVLVAERDNIRIRMLSADLQQVSTVAGDGEHGHRDGAAAQAQFACPTGILVLPDGCVLVADQGRHCIRRLSAHLQQVSSLAGGDEYGVGVRGYRDGAAAQARFSHPLALALLSDGRVLVADTTNHCIRMLSADLQQVSTVAGGDEWPTEGHFDGDAELAMFHSPAGLVLLPDGRVLVRDNSRIRVLSADLQQVSTLTNVGELDSLSALELLPDGRLLVGAGNRIRVLEGFPAALLSTKPSHKSPKKTKQQQQKEKKKRALAGGASSTGRLVPKSTRSGASSRSAAAAAVSSSESESEEQPGGSAAEAVSLVCESARREAKALPTAHSL